MLHFLKLYINNVFINDNINCNRENTFVSENMNTFNCQVDPPFIGYDAYFLSVNIHACLYKSMIWFLTLIYMLHSRYAKPWVDLDTGDTRCLFFPYSPEHLVHSMSRSKDTKPHVSFSINASVKEGRHVSGSASALLIGGFSVARPNKVI